MSPSRRILTLFPLCLLFLGGCRSSLQPKEGQALRSARDATVYSTIVSRAIAALPHPTRPSASLGVYVSTYISTEESPIHGAIESLTLLSPLARPPDATDTPFTTIQTLGDLVQTNIAEAMNKNPERGEVLNRYLTLLHSALQHAQKDKENVDNQRGQLVEKEREQQHTVRTLQKEINAAEKAGDFSRVGFQQRALSEAKGEQGKTEALIDELESTIEILDDLMNVAEERLHAIEENREALMSGIRVVEIPGIEKLGILEKGDLPLRRFQRKERNRGMLDFSDI